MKILKKMYGNTKRQLFWLIIGLVMAFFAAFNCDLLMAHIGILSFLVLGGLTVSAIALFCIFSYFKYDDK